MARPRGKRFPLPTMEQLHAGLDATEASANSERLLDMWLERDDDPVDRMGPRVLPDGTRGPDRNVFHTISVDGTGQRMDVRAKIPSSYMHLIGTMIARREIPQYNTIGDFVRDAIYHRIWDVAEGRKLRPVDLERLKVEEMQAATEAAMERMEMNNALVTEARATLSRLHGQPGFGEYLETLRLTAAYVENPWRAQLLKLADEYEGGGG